MPASALFSPLSLRGTILRNRIVLSPMCQYYAVEGAVQDWHYAHHARFALGGLGAAFVEATGVTPEGRSTHGCTGLYSDAHGPGLARIASLYRQHGVVPGIQLTHSGRKASAARPWDGAAPLALAVEGGWETIAPSAIPVRDGWPTPRAMTLADIDAAVLAFRTAAQRALAAGFDMIELHGAHGYLLHSFLSPVSNRRDDRFGGSLENRLRFPVMTAKAVREVWPDDKPVFYRTSAVDNVEGGLDIDDTIALAGALKAVGTDVLDCSSGGISGPVALAKQVPTTAGFQVPYAAAVRRATGMATMAVGLIVEPRMAEEIVAGGQADLVALGRELIADPNWAYRAARELQVEDPHGVLPPSYAFYMRRRPPLAGSSAASR